MSLLSAIANHWVLPAAIPYLAIAGYDFWLHETDRKVPRTESFFHAGIIVGVVSFLAAAVLGHDRLAAAALVVLLLAAIVDEVRYHSDLDAREKRLHYFGGTALMFCIAVWLWTA